MWRAKLERRLLRALARCFRVGRSAPFVHILCAHEQDVAPSISLTIKHFPDSIIGGPVVERVMGTQHALDLARSGRTVFVGRLDEMCFLYLRAKRSFSGKLHLFEWAPAVLVNYDPKTEGDALCVLDESGPSQGLQLHIQDYVAIHRDIWQVRGTFESATLEQRISSFQHHMTYYQGIQGGVAGTGGASSESGN